MRSHPQSRFWDSMWVHCLPPSFRQMCHLIKIKENNVKIIVTSDVIRNNKITEGGRMQSVYYRYIEDEDKYFTEEDIYVCV